MAKSLRAIAGDTPVILLGDFNSNRRHAETGRTTRMFKAYRSQFYEAFSTCTDIQSTPTADTKASDGTWYTYNKWLVAPSGDSHLDHIYYRGMKVNKIRICNDTYTYSGAKANITDHFPVYVETEITPVKARTIYVSAERSGGNGTMTAPYRTIAQAVAAAALDDTIKVTAATYKESINPKLSVHIIGGYDRSFSKITGRTTIDGTGLSARPIDADEHISLTLANFDIVNYKSASADTDGAIAFCGQDLVMENVTVENCSAVANGGLKCHRDNKYAEAHSITMKNCVFRNNTAANGGGAFLGVTDRLRIDQCSFEGNSVTGDGAGLYINTGESDTSTVWFTNADHIIYNSSFTENTGVGSGAIYFRDMMPNVRLTIVNTAIANNTVTGTLGGAAIRAELNPAVTYSSITKKAGILNLGHCTITGNHSAQIAAVRVTGKGTVGILNNIIAGNSTGNGSAADMSLVDAGRDGTNRTNNVYTAKDKSSVVFTADASDKGAASYAAGMAAIADFIDGQYDGTRFTANLSYDRLTPQPVLKSQSFAGSKLTIAPNSRNMESAFGVDLSGSGTASAPLRKDQNGNFRKYSSMLGANEYNPTRTTTSHEYFANVSGSGNQDGTNWQNALAAGDLVTVLPMIENGDVLYLKAGTYSATQTALEVCEGATVIGGFPTDATGTDISGYDPWTNITVFDAKSKNNGTPFLTVTGKGKWAAKTVIKGIKITNCNHSASAPIFDGTALKVTNQAWVLAEDVAFADNTSYSGGPVVIWNGSRFHARRCVWSGNVNENPNSNATKSSNNRSQTVLNARSSNYYGQTNIVLEGCAIFGNKIKNNPGNVMYGGAINLLDGHANLAMVNCFADGGGQTIYQHGSFARLNNKCESHLFLFNTLYNYNVSQSAGNGRVISINENAPFYAQGNIIVSPTSSTVSGDANTAAMFAQKWSGDYANMKDKVQSGGNNVISGLCMEEPAGFSIMNQNSTDKWAVGNQSTVFGTNTAVVKDGRKCILPKAQYRNVNMAEAMNRFRSFEMPACFKWAGIDPSIDMFGNYRPDVTYAGSYDPEGTSTGVTDVTVTTLAVTSLGHGLYTVNGLDADTTCTVYNMAGTAVISTTLSAGNTTLDLSSLPAGVYILRTTDAIAKILR